MPPVEFEPTISAGERPQTYALDRAATGTGNNNNNNNNKELDPRKASRDIDHKNDEGRLKKEYLRTLKLVLDTELSAKNKIQEIGLLAVPILRYNFGIINP